MPFPVTPRYFINFRNSDTGLTPTFVFFKNASSFANITAPSVTELSNGEYYFDWTWSTKTDADIVFELDGGASIPTEEVRYVKGTLSPRDRYLDEPISQVVTDVWTDSVSYSAGQKGKRVDQLGDPTDASSASTMFGKELLYKESIRGDSAGGSDGDSIKVARDRIMGGTGFGGTGVDIKTVKDTIGTPADTSSASTVFGKELLYTERIRGDSAGLTDGENVKLARDRVMGGTGFGGTGVDVKTVYDRVGAPLGGFSTIADQIGDPSGSNSIAQDIAALQSSENTINSKIGTPVTTVSGDIAAIQTKLGTPAGASVSADIASVKSDSSAIKAKTDNLPSDPASQSTTNASITSSTTSIKGGSNIDNTQLQTIELAVKAKTDNLPSDPASQSTTNTSITSAQTSIKGADNRDLTQIAGTGTFVPGTDDLHSIKQAINTTPTAPGIADAVWDELLSGHTTAGSAGKKLTDGALTTDITAAQVSIKGSGNIDNTQLTNKLGTPIGASVSADIAAVKTDTSTINTNTSGLGTQLTRALGLMHENSVLDQTIFDGSNNLTNGRLRIYNSKANALLAGLTGLVNTYTIAASYIGENVQTYTVVLEP